MAKTRLEWQVELKHSGYYLNGRGETPEKAMSDLLSRLGSQIDTAESETSRLRKKLDNLEIYGRALKNFDYDQVARDIDHLDMGSDDE